MKAQMVPAGSFMDEQDGLKGPSTFSDLKRTLFNINEH